jgi:hypothetical protein
MVLFPWDEPPARAELSAVFRAARSVGDDGIFRTQAICADSEPPHLYAALDDYEGFAALLPETTFESTLFSPTGRWAIVTTDFDDALVGALDELFIDTLSEALPPVSGASRPHVIEGKNGRWELPLAPILPGDQVRPWISLWRFQGIQRERLALYLADIYRDDEAKRLLDEEWPRASG